MTMSIVLCALAALVLLVIVVHHIRLLQAIRPPPRPQLPVSLPRYPSVTVIRPVRGLDVNAEANTRALLELEYPGELEILFVFDEVPGLDDPGACPVRTELARHSFDGTHRRAEVMTAPSPPHGRTGKLNAMIAGMHRARGELVAFCDSDTRPARNLLARLVETLLTTPRAGDAFAPVVVSDPLRTAGDVGYALMQNAWYGPSVARAAGAERTLPFIMGQFMVFRREALGAIGGLGCADWQLVDDMYIGRRIEQAGYKNVMLREQLTISTGGMGIGEFARLYRRWMLFSRNGLPAAFTVPNWLRGFEFWAALALLGFSFPSGAWGAMVLSLVAAASSLMSQAVLHRRFGGAPIPIRYAWMPLAVPLLAPLIVVSCWLFPQVAWRGRPYAIGKRASLA